MRPQGRPPRRAATGRLLLRESAQCPPDETEDFQDITKFSLFNTNNLWLDLAALREMLRAADGLPQLPLIVNRKTVDPVRSDSPAVVQLEAAMGSAISCFDNAAALVFPRFAPVKTTNDLLAIRSDLYTLGEEHRVARCIPSASVRPPAITLDAVLPQYCRL